MDVKIFPNPLIITRENENDYFQSYLTIKNLSNNIIIFKVFLSQKSMSYTVKPILSFLNPFKQINILFTKVNHNEENNIKDKCLIRIYPINKSIETNEEAKELINNKNYNEKEVIEEIIYILNDVKNSKNNDLRLKIIKIGKDIENLRQQLETIKINKIMMKEKTNSLKQKDNKKNKNENHSIIFSLFIILLTLILGAYLAKIKNIYFSKPK